MPPVSRIRLGKGWQGGGLLLLLLFSQTLWAKSYTHWNLIEARYPETEKLVYRLSYKGLFTAFMWKGLANVAFVADLKPHLFSGKSACHLNLRVSTEQYGFSETLHPVRFIWRTTVDPSLSQVFVTEEINEIVDGKYALVWLDYANQHIELFRKRRRIPDEIIYAEDEEGESDLDQDIVVSSHWEKDGKKKLPAFLDTFPRLENGMSYMVHDKTSETKLAQPVLDPLSLLYAARLHDYRLLGDLVVDVNYKDRINPYTAHRVGREVIKVAGREMQAVRIRLTRSNLEEAKEEGFMIMWLSDDERKLPLQYMVDAKFGKIKIHLTERTLSDYRRQPLCIEQHRVTRNE